MLFISAVSFLLLESVWGNANPGYIKCPKPDELCKYASGIHFSISHSGAPECWIRPKASNKERATCYNKPFKGSCKSNDGSIDISNCPGYKPKIDPTCPTEKDVCRFKGMQSIPYNKEKAPRCWAKVDGKWLCDIIPKNGNCYEGADGSGGIDIATCKPKGKGSYCPEPGTMCLMGGDMAFDFGRINTPECWVKEENGTPSCYNKSERETCYSYDNHYDVTNCRGFKYINPDCPKNNESCRIGDIMYDISQPFAPQCWKKSGNRYKCTDIPKNGSCYSLDGYFHRSEC